MVKKQAVVLSVLFSAFAVFAQDIQHDAIVVNIEVPVRVFKGNTFIDSLTMADFEIYEDGILQKAEAMYLVNKTNIMREDSEMDSEEARQKFAPQVSRNFVLLFEIHEYLPQIEKAVDYFFNDVYQPEDSLTVVTPQQTYRFNSQGLEKLTKDEISDQLAGKIRKDVRLSASEYRSLIHEFDNLAANTEGLQEDLVQMMQASIIRRLRNLRYLDEGRLLNFAEALKNTAGPKHVFFFLQKMMIPLLSSSIFSASPSLTTGGNLERFEAYTTYDENKIKRIFSDSSITAHMIYLTKVSDSDLLNRDLGSLTAQSVLDTSNPSTPREFQDITANVYSTFGEVAVTTGGIVDSSANPAASFRKTMEASEQYYLLYYSPKNYVADGKFREITVKVKGQKYKITHRAGYIAD